MASSKHVLIFLLYLINSLKCHHISEKDSKIGIIGGHQISIEKAPFMVSLRLNGTYHWCGGSIIHEKFILTAAHCIVPNRDYKILVGTDDVDDGGELYNIEKIFKHNNYASSTDDYDICLIKLNATITMGPKVKKIDLATKSTKVKKGTILQVTGWGNTKPEGTISKKLLQVAVPLISARICQRSYFSSLRSITSRMMCAGGHGRDSCQGDSGGPLTMGDLQVGLASFGAECGVLPGVYTKISTLSSWIWQTIDENS